MNRNYKKYKFTMSYKALFGLCMEKIAYLYTDIGVLQDRGITTARLLAFENLINTFTNVPENAVTRAVITVDKDQRNAYVQQLKAAYKELWGIAKVALGDKSVEYKTLHPTSISQLNIEALYELSFSVLPTAQKYFAQLQPYGFTVSMYNNIKTLEDQVATARINTDKTKSNRLLVTQQRQAAANELYTELKKMCSIAYTYFENRNKVKASMYLIYKTKGKYQQSNGTVAANSIKTIKLKNISNGHRFKIMVTNGNNMAFYFSKTVGGEPHSKTLEVPVNNSEILECAATRLGYNSSKGAVHFCIKNTEENSMASGYKVKVVR